MTAEMQQDFRYEAWDAIEERNHLDAIEAIRRRRAERKPRLKGYLAALPVGGFLSDGIRVWRLSETGAIESFAVWDAAAYGIEPITAEDVGDDEDSLGRLERVFMQNPAAAQAHIDQQITNSGMEI